jgi:hypothetical protein
VVEVWYLTQLIAYFYNNWGILRSQTDVSNCWLPIKLFGFYRTKHLQTADICIRGVVQKTPRRLMDLTNSLYAA